MNMLVVVRFRNGKTWTGQVDDFGTRFGDGGIYLKHGDNAPEYRVRIRDIQSIALTPEGDTQP